MSSARPGGSARKALAAAAALSLLVSSFGCAVHQSADPHRAAGGAVDPDTLVWPARRTSDLDAIAAASPKQLFTRAVDRRGEKPRILRTAQFDVVSVEPAGLGLIRVLAGAAEESKRRQIFEFMSWPPGTRDPEQLIGRDEVNLRLLPRSTRYMRLLPPRADDVQGLLLHVRSIVPNRFEEALIDRLRGRGWWVLEASFITTLKSETKVRLRSLDEKSLRRAAKRAAVQADLRLAHRAYAIEAALDYLAVHRPDVPQDPIVAVGLSAGALGLPTIVARSIERIDAAVIVAGGANLFEISQRSSLTDGGVNIEWPDGRASKRALSRLYELYLEASHLDPWHTAPVLRSIPVLQLHGMFDAIVPASAGEALYERLGRPERWSFAGGHGLVFWLLPGHAGRIGDWLERAVYDRPAAPVDTMIVGAE